MSNNNENDLPLLLPKVRDFVKNNYKNADKYFAYYTTADTAYKIIKNKEIWMRNSSLLNDYKEVKFGDEMVRRVLFDELKDELENTLKSVEYDGGMEGFKDNYERMENDILNNTFVLSLSRHSDEEDRLGRLSMWREYGRKNGVVFVFEKSELLSILTNFSKVSLKNGYTAPFELLMPVFYLKDDDFSKEHFFKKQYSAVLNDIRENPSKYTSDEYSSPNACGNELLLLACISTMHFKHLGFSEENEVRYIIASYTDGLGYFHTVDDSVKHNIVINGVPQTVYKVKLEDSCYENRLKWSNLIKQIIIGPNNPENAVSIKNTFFNLLSDDDSDFCKDKIVMSDIPVRL